MLKKSHVWDIDKCFKCKSRKISLKSKEVSVLKTVIENMPVVYCYQCGTCYISNDIIQNIENRLLNITNYPGRMTFEEVNINYVKEVDDEGS